MVGGKIHVRESPREGGSLSGWRLGRAAALPNLGTALVLGGMWCWGGSSLLPWHVAGREGRATAGGDPSRERERAAHSLSRLLTPLRGSLLTSSFTSLRVGGWRGMLGIRPAALGGVLRTPSSCVWLGEKAAAA